METIENWFIFSAEIIEEDELSLVIVSFHHHHHLNECHPHQHYLVFLTIRYLGACEVALEMP